MAWNQQTQKVHSYNFSIQSQTVVTIALSTLNNHKFITCDQILLWQLLVGI